MLGEASLVVPTVASNQQKSSDPTNDTIMLETAPCVVGHRCNVDINGMDQASCIRDEDPLDTDGCRYLRAAPE